jgi:hypothetical protein
VASSCPQDHRRRRWCMGNVRYHAGESISRIRYFATRAMCSLFVDYDDLLDEALAMAKPRSIQEVVMMMRGERQWLVARTRTGLHLQYCFNFFDIVHVQPDTFSHLPRASQRPCLVSELTTGTDCECSSQMKIREAPGSDLSAAYTASYYT